MIKNFTDRYKSKYRYSQKYPVGITGGLNFLKKFTNSPKWKNVESKKNIHEHNSNRMDQFLGNSYIFENVENGAIVKIKESHSNTGKTVNWTFESDSDVWEF